jgi:exodeoxyribonuclease V beta subunit
VTGAAQLALGLRADSTPMTPFDLAGPLPTGVTLLEASAGTGKTYAIAGLAARYVAEGTPLDQLLVVTFTRAATGELRERVRDRLVRTVDGLDRFIISGSLDERDEVLLSLTDGDLAKVRERRERLAGAVAAFDAATIDTTHGFCLHVLAGLGVSGDVDLRARLVEDVTDLVEQVVDDLYVQKYWRGRSVPLFPRGEAIKIAEKVLYNPGVRVLPDVAPGDDPSLVRARLAAAVVRETGRRKRAAGILTYDDLLTRLRDTLLDPERGPAARHKLRERYRVVLVDEFQDTDVVQWEILSRAFVAPGSTLVLIGDPKQSIYAFRGADVYSYLAAAAEAASRHTLDVNWRSDAGLLRAFDAVFGGSQLGDTGIVYRDVSAAPPHVQARLDGAPNPAPLRIRFLDRELVVRTGRGYAAAGSARAAIAKDLAADIVELLSSNAELISRRPDGTESGRETVRPGHVAVLVRTAANAAVVQAELQRAGVPCVIAGAGSVFDSAAAQHWLRLLEAVEQPTRRDKAAAAALTPFFGRDADEVAATTEQEWEDLHYQLHRWSSLLRRRGAAALLEDVSASQFVPERVLTYDGGERLLTDIRHIGQLLHQESVSESLGSAALVGWLRRRINERLSENDDPDRSIRLESDAESVQILTIHRSKGLEFPIVYCPFAWDHWDFKVEIPVFHDPDHGLARCVDVGVDESLLKRHGDRETSELRGEDLRLLYVALTRARHQVVLWWAGSEGGRNAAFNRLVLAPCPGGVVSDKGVRTPDDADARSRLESLAESAGGEISIETADPNRLARWWGEGGGVPHLDAATFDRTLDSVWRRSSFSSITAGTYTEHVWSEPASDAISDEQVPGERTGPSEAGDVGDPAAETGEDDGEVEASGEVEAGGKVEAGGEVEAGNEAGRVGGAGSGLLGPSSVLPLSSMPGNVDVGTVIHKVLEVVDFTSTELEHDLHEALLTECQLRQVDLGDLETVVTGVHAAIESPLGPLVPDVRLRDIGLRDRVDEMSFELPLVGGDHVSGHLSLAAIADTLRSHLPPGDRLAAYADRLGDSALQRELRGFLTGSLDLVFRVGHDDESRFFVADYKTNRLSPEGVPLTPWHYRPEALQVEMLHVHYPLQGLLYVVALHRYLRWRVRDYSPQRHLGGVLYLFLRGMSPLAPTFGADRSGVWSWKPPEGLIEAMSDLFDRGAG